MNRPFDFNSCEDFENMSCIAELRPNRSIEIRNLSGDQITRRPFLEHARILCKNNETNLLSLLTGIQNKINRDMLVRGNNIPLFKQKVNSVISEWPFGNTYEDIFSVPDSNPFDYNDLVQCNAIVLDLDNDMIELDDLVSQDSDDLYERITGVQSKCLDISDNIKTCMGNLDQIADIYEPKYPKILMDLSTRQKSYYTTNKDITDPLTDRVHRKSCKDIPDNIPDIFSNAVLIPNMISKESEYVKSLLQNLHDNVRNKQLVLSDLQGQVPQSREAVMTFDPVKRFFQSLMESSGEEEEGGGEGGEEGQSELSEEDIQEIHNILNEGVNTGVGQGEAEITLEELSDTGNPGSEGIGSEGIGTEEQKLLEGAKSPKDKQKGGYELSFF